jgi:hypothetical protein
LRHCGLQNIPIVDQGSKKVVGMLTAKKLTSNFFFRIFDIVLLNEFIPMFMFP